MLLVALSGAGIGRAAGYSVDELPVVAVFVHRQFQDTPGLRDVRLAGRRCRTAHHAIPAPTAGAHDELPEAGWVSRPVVVIHRSKTLVCLVLGADHQIHAVLLHDAGHGTHVAVAAQGACARRIEAPLPRDDRDAGLLVVLEISREPVHLLRRSRVERSVNSERGGTTMLPVGRVKHHDVPTALIEREPALVCDLQCTGRGAGTEVAIDAVRPTIRTKVSVPNRVVRP